MNKVRIKGAFIFIIAIASCAKKPTQTITDNKLSGKFENYTGQLVYFESITPAQLIRLDTLEINEDGTFEFYADVNQLGFYRISENQNNFLNLILSETDDINITADIKSLPTTYKIS